MDSMIGSKDKLGFAMFYVNMEMDKSLPTMVDLTSKWCIESQPLIYENVAPFYQKSNSFGHLFVEWLKKEKLKSKVCSPGVEVVKTSNAAKRVAMVNTELVGCEGNL